MQFLDEFDRIFCAVAISGNTGGRSRDRAAIKASAKFPCGHRKNALRSVDMRDAMAQAPPRHTGVGPAVEGTRST
jgi:hypothetical protein